MTKSNLFDRIGSATCFCGLCCNADKMCENCMRATLRANGIEVNEANMNQLRAVKSAERGRYGGETNYTWVVMRMLSELYLLK